MNEPIRDPIQPDYYRWHPSGVECITIAQAFPYNLGAAIKYIWRAGRKHAASTVEDLKKARQYLEFEIQRREREERRREAELASGEVTGVEAVPMPPTVTLQYPPALVRREPLLGVLVVEGVLPADDDDDEPCSPSCTRCASCPWK